MEKVKKKLLILGSTGMLGHVVFNYLNQQDEFELYDIVYRNKLRDESIVCDITNVDQLKITINSIKPDYIVNCIGILIKGSTHNPANAIFINSYFPHLLVQIADELNSKVIHISTDCVFSGKKGGYSETDFRDADDTYGRSKALGEINNDRHLTIRTSIVGPELKDNGEGLLNWFLNQKGETNGFTKALWGGVTTVECAKAIRASIQQSIIGLVNLTNGQTISKYNMLVLFKEKLAKRDLIIHAVEGKEVNKSLISERLDFEYNVPSYDQMFEEMASEIFKNKSTYQHYQI